MYYLYRHIRLDKNEPFYIGIGTITPQNTYTSIYKRAFSRFNRNIHWNRIVSKTAFSVDILYEDNNMSVIKQKEQEFIKLYGRSDYGGTLCNLTDGGDGIKNVAQEVRRKISLKLTGIKRSEEQKRRQSERTKGKKLNPSHIENIRKCRIGWVFTNETKKKMSQSRIGMRYEDKRGFQHGAAKRNGIPIYCMETGITYISCRDACEKIFGKRTNALTNGIKRGRFSYRGFTFKLI